MELKNAYEYKVKDIETLNDWAARNGIETSVAHKKAIKGLIPAFKFKNSSVWFIRKDVKNYDARTLKTPRNSRAKTYYDKNLATHCCVRCGNPLPENYSMKTCPDCREKRKVKKD